MKARGRKDVEKRKEKEGGWRKTKEETEGKAQWMEEEKRR